MIERTPKNLRKTVSADSGAHFCCANYQPIFSCGVAALHGSAATWRRLLCESKRRCSVALRSFDQLRLVRQRQVSAVAENCSVKRCGVGSVLRVLLALRFDPRAINTDAPCLSRCLFVCEHVIAPLLLSAHADLTKVYHITLQQIHFPANYLGCWRCWLLLIHDRANSKEPV